jgi:hypothetical protein
MVGVAPEVWFPVVTLVIGIVLKIVADVFADRRALKAQKELRDHENRYTSMIRRTAFQRETLLKLQECVQDTSRAANEVFLSDLANASLGHGWSRAKIPEEIDQKFFNTQRKLSLLQSRVRDEEVRTICEKMKSYLIKFSFPKDQNEAMELLGHISSQSDQLNERVGLILRELDEAEEKSEERDMR